jgi:sucrose-6-phosphate hydrolase SacC (GH32 family)
MKKLTILLSFILTSAMLFSQEIVKEYKIEKQYLNFPIEMKQDRQMVQFLLNKDTLTYNVIRIAVAEPDYWVFKDVSAYKGKTLKLVFAKDVAGLQKIYQSDAFAGQDSLYKESKRPQFHFSSRRGWNNDPNGLVFFEGEYHLFYQHNPFEINWENMTWGHAVSPDLVHWTELNDVLYPDPLGTMFSGSAVIDKNNTSGWGRNAMVAAYTADKKGVEVQCVAYSTDKGRTFTKYEGNPVVGPTRDPKVIWYEPNQEWVMALYDVAGISFHTSKNLKDWKKESHINGFFECPELFELPVDGNPNKKLWVAYGGSGTYLLGDFNGKVFTPRYGKYRYTYGNHYAAQTYNNTPDGKRIQIGWGTIESKGMPFNQMMCFPTELTLRTTNEGIRIFSEPVKAIEKLHTNKMDLSGLSVTEANVRLIDNKNDLLHVVARLESLDGKAISIDYKGNRYAQLDGDEINGVQTPRPNAGSLVFDVELLIDRTSVEGYFQKGQIVFVNPLANPKKDAGLEILGDAKNIKIHKLEVYQLESIWKK